MRKLAETGHKKKARLPVDVLARLPYIGMVRARWCAGHKETKMSAIKEVKFARLSSHQMDAVSRIWDRVGARYKGEKMSFVMDMCATAYHCPIDFERLSNADDFNLIHDVFGIRNFLDRETGMLTNFFRPRFATKETQDAA